MGGEETEHSSGSVVEPSGDEKTGVFERWESPIDEREETGMELPPPEERTMADYHVSLLNKKDSEWAEQKLKWLSSGWPYHLSFQLGPFKRLKGDSDPPTGTEGTHWDSPGQIGTNNSLTDHEDRRNKKSEFFCFFLNFF